MIAAEKPLSIREIEIAIKIAKSPINPYSFGERNHLWSTKATIKVTAKDERFSMNPHLAPFTAVCFRLSATGKLFYSFMEAAAWLKISKPLVVSG